MLHAEAPHAPGEPGSIATKSLTVAAYDDASFFKMIEDFSFWNIDHHTTCILTAASIGDVAEDKLPSLRAYLWVTATPGRHLAASWTNPRDLRWLEKIQHCIEGAADSSGFSATTVWRRLT